MIINQHDIFNYENRFRANLINSLGGFKSIVLIGTKSQSGNENLALFSSLFHIGAHPPLCGIIIRPNEESENTLGNIIGNSYYTINHITPDFYKKAHQCSAKYPPGMSEFESVGLTSEYIDGICVPFVKESKIKFACKIVQKIPLEINGTTLIIGSIENIIIPEEFIHNDGFINLEKAQTITCSGLDSYHTTQILSRLSYAKVNEDIIELNKKPEY